MKKTKPKSNKSAKRGAKISPKKAAKKELESGIAERFLDVVSNLGHDAERIAKDIKKMSKEIAKKLSEKLKSSKKADKVATARKIKAEKVIAKREVKASQKGVVKTPAKTVTTSAGKAPVKPVVKRTPQLTSPNVDQASKPRTRRPAQATLAAKSKDTAEAPVQKRTRRPATPKIATEAQAPLAAKAPADNNNVIESEGSLETVETKSE
jgi:hypothetical protein